MAIEHKNITDAERHEPKGASTALVGTHLIADGEGGTDWKENAPSGVEDASIYDVFVSDGVGSGSWKKPTRMGWENYEDTETAGSPIILTPQDTFVKMTNDGLGVKTNTTFKLPEATALWNTVTNQLDFTSLEVGDIVRIRMSLAVTTAGANHDIKLAIRFGLGASEFDIDVAFAAIKSAGVTIVSATLPIFLGDDNIKDNPAEILIQSDTGTADEVVIDGFFIEVTSRGDD